MAFSENFFQYPLLLSYVQMEATAPNIAGPEQCWGLLRLHVAKSMTGFKL